MRRDLLLSADWRTAAGVRVSFLASQVRDKEREGVIGALKAAEWRYLKDYVSPAFFRVLGTRSLTRQVASLTRNLGRREGFRRALAQTQTRLVGLDIGIVERIEEPTLFQARQALDPDARKRAGEAILDCFFDQVLSPSPKILDLRLGRLGWRGHLSWSPAPVWTEWGPDFAAGVAGLYRGFYGGDDELFCASLDQLRIRPAETTFRAHFGADRQGAVRFELSSFHATFHEVFVVCREAGNELPGDFVSLGIFLAMLYESLEGLGGAFDVRSSFERVAPRAEKNAA